MNVVLTVKELELQNSDLGSSLVISKQPPFSSFLLQIVGVLLLRERIELYLHKCHKVGHLQP